MRPILSAQRRLLAHQRDPYRGLQVAGECARARQNAAYLGDQRRIILSPLASASARSSAA